MKKRTFLIPLFAVLLAGCATYSEEQLKEQFNSNLACMSKLAKSEEASLLPHSHKKTYCYAKSIGDFSDAQMDNFLFCMSKLAKSEKFSSLLVTDRKYHCYCYAHPYVGSEYRPISCDGHELVVGTVKEEIEK